MGGTREAKTTFLSRRMSSEKEVLHSGNSPVSWRLQLPEVAFISSWDLNVLKKNHFLNILPRHMEQSNAHVIESEWSATWEKIYREQKLQLKQNFFALMTTEFVPDGLSNGQWSAFFSLPLSFSWNVFLFTGKLGCGWPSNLEAEKQDTRVSALEHHSS